MEPTSIPAIANAPALPERTEIASSGYASSSWMATSPTSRISSLYLAPPGRISPMIFIRMKVMRADQMMTNMAARICSHN